MRVGCRVPAATAAWVQVWSDEFDEAGRSVDTTKWGFDLGGGGWGNNEREYYTSDTANVRLNGQGELEIVARVAPAGLTCWYGPCSYTSARILTRGKMTVFWGRGSQSTTTSSAVHGPGYSGNTPFAHAYSPVTTTDYHVYSVEWDGQSIRYSVDGNQYHIVRRSDVGTYGSWVFDQPFFVILNLAVGGNFDGNPASDAIFPATMLVDWVRVYRLQ